MIVVMAHALNRWTDWQAEQLDPEVPENLRSQNQEITATFAMLCCAPLVVLIATIDFLMPANYNLAILYPIPMFIVGWTSSRRLLWAMLAVLLTLTAAAYLWGPRSPDPDQELSLVRNRILAGFGMVTVTIVLHYWMRREETANS